MAAEKPISMRDLVEAAKRGAATATNAKDRRFWSGVKKEIKNTTKRAGGSSAPYPFSKTP